MTDDFLLKVRDAWHGQDASFEAVQMRLRRARWGPHAVLTLELLSTAFALLVGVWFAWKAVTTGLLIFTLSAIVMLLTTPAVAIASYLVRRESLRWEDETPDGVLRTALRRAEASLRAARVGRWHVGVVAAFVAILWVTQALGWIDEPGFLIFYTSACAAAFVPYLFWMRSRVHRLHAERAKCERLLQDLHATE